MRESADNSHMNQNAENKLTDEKQAQIRAVLDRAREVASDLQRQRSVDRDTLLKPYTL